MSKFWVNWLNIWCFGLIAFGTVLALAGIEGFEGGARLILTLQNPENRQFSMMWNALPLALWGPSPLAGD